jgi:hypothetical protein
MTDASTSENMSPELMKVVERAQRERHSSPGLRPAWASARRDAARANCAQRAR